MPPTIEIEALVRDKNQVTIPRQIAERHRIRVGQRLIIVDGQHEDEFTLRVIRSTYAGVLAGMFGTMDENVAYVRGEREDWG